MRGIRVSPDGVGGRAASPVPAQTINVEQLRARLERVEPVTVLDVRPATERAEWAIPGSVHVDAYHALWRGDPTALQDFQPPSGGPVVTVCAAGRTSLIAAAQLRARGMDAVSLDGGMQAWSLAWNTADVPRPGIAATILQVRRTGKGCLSYLVGSNGEAAVVDASLDPEVYLELARRRGWRIRFVLETHVHADHLSRARALAAATGATLHLPTTDRVSFTHAPLRDGDVVRVGSARLVTLQTPGHTMESACYHLDERAVFTGDTLFLAAVGRPDLEATPEETQVRARLLHRSLHRLLALPGDTLILPCHTSTPVAFDGRPVAAELQKARERTELLRADEATFVATLLARIPATPPNHHRIVALNEAGTLPEGDPTELEAGANRCAVA
jgi:glyoxylase-like metal-dependent hydrolase (beta-lactamase superfamily II)/rhodanese-related sulfurtransferase